MPNAEAPNRVVPTVPNVTPELLTSQGKRGPHILACLECRIRKLRCIPGQGANSKCQRCVRNDTECIFRQRRRPRQRAVKLRNRVEQLEQSLEGIVSLFTNNEHNAIQSTKNADVSYHPPSVTTASPSTTSETLVNSKCQDDLFDRGLITMGEAASLCEKFRRMSETHFPYVILDEDYGVAWLRNEKPLLLQAILTTASWQNRPLQLVLEEELVKNMALSFFNSQEKMIDTLQAILVYIGWFHFHIKSPTPQFYRLASVATTIVIELGLHRRTEDSRLQGAGSVPESGSTLSDRQESIEFWSVEARRALLGCYILCSTTAIASRKSNPLPYTEYLETCALSLQNELHVPSDAGLIQHLQLIYLAEEIANTFNYADRSEDVPALRDKRIKFCVKEFERQVNKIRAKLSPLSRQSRNIEMWCLSIGLYGHEIAISNQGADGDLSISRMALLFDCLVKAKEYFSVVLALPFEDMHSWSILEWRVLHHLVVSTSKIFTRIDTAAWNDDLTTAIADFDTSVESLYNRVRGLHLLTNSADGHKTGFQQLLFLWEAVRMSNRATLDLMTAASIPAMNFQGVENTQPLEQGRQIALGNATNYYLHGTEFGLYELELQGQFWVPSSFST